MRTFKEFLAQRESTAAKRAKNAAFLGLAVPGPEAGFHSGATANPGYLDYYEKHVKGKNCKKKKKKKKKLDEGRTIPPVHHEIDTWLGEVDKLKRDLEKLPQDDSRILPHELGDDEDDLEDDKGFEEDGDEAKEEGEEGDEEDQGEEEEFDDDPDHPINQELDNLLSGHHPTHIVPPRTGKSLEKPDFKEWIKAKR